MIAFDILAALAHAGHHDGSADGLLHALTEPTHLLAAAAIVASLIVARAACRHVRFRAMRVGRQRKMVRG